jgi:conjugative relaxase-like TrwC/TraI family protein
VLNIGRLGQGAVNYYVGEIASSTEDYYLGHGEAPGRWVGSLAERLKLRGKVDETHFRRVLDGKHPFTGKYLITAKGSAARAAARRAPPAPTAVTGASLDTLQAACQLGVSEQRVRQLLAVGVEAAERRAAELAAGVDPSPLPKSYLIGSKVESPTGPQRESWQIPQEEIDRFLAIRKQAKARPGYDLVLRPPKSVSVLWALGGQQVRATVRRAHVEAVDEAVRFIESQAVSARSKGERTATYGVVAAAFDHRTSRAGDPLLHTHVVTANMTRTVDGNWRTLDARGLFDHGRAGGAVYQAHLRHLLTRDLGVAWEPVVNGHADIAGMPREVITLFSKRREEISELVAEAGLSSARAHQAATLASRQAKEHGVDQETLETHWRSEARSIGYDPEDLSSCLHRAEPHPVTEEELAEVFAHLASPRGLTERTASFCRDDVVVALAGQLVAQVDAEELGRLADRFLSSRHVVALVGASTGRQRTIVIDAEGSTLPVLGEIRYSTPELLEIEERVLGWAADGFGTPVPTADLDAVEAAIAARPELTAEQVTMVRALSRTDEAIQPVVGRAGSGKTHAVRAAVDAFLVCGIPVLGCSVSATAAARLEESTQLRRLTGRPCDTVARLLVELNDPDGGGFLPRTVCIVDEASALGTRDLARLAEHLSRVGGALKLVGDPDQLSSVDVGGAFRVIAASRGEHLVTLSANLRQQDEQERLAVADYREGRIAEALARYDLAGKIVRSPTASTSLGAMAADWYADRLAGVDAPMIVGPNAMRRKLNARARALLKADGTITDPGLKAAGTEFCVGDEIVTRENDRRLRSPDGKAFVKNGSAGTVIEVDLTRRTLVVQFRREGRIRLPAIYLDRGKVEHAYAQTNFLAQGSDQRRTKYHPTDASRFEEGYVGITRAVEETRLYIVDGHREHADEDLVHEPEKVLESGLAEMTIALEHRGAQSMAREADPSLMSRHRDLDHLDLRSLRQERQRLEAILSKAPPSVDTALSAATRTRDQLLVQRRAWVANLECTATSPSGDQQTDQVEPPARRATQAIAMLDHVLARTEGTIARLLKCNSERRAFLEVERSVIDRLAAVRRAEAARESRVRTAAVAGLSALGQTTLQPRDERQRLAWTRTIQDLAMQSERSNLMTVPEAEIP